MWRSSGSRTTVRVDGGTSRIPLWLSIRLRLWLPLEFFSGCGSSEPTMPNGLGVVKVALVSQYQYLTLTRIQVALSPRVECRDHLDAYPLLPMGEDLVIGGIFLVEDRGIFRHFLALWFAIYFIGPIVDNGKKSKGIIRWGWLSLSWGWKKRVLWHTIWVVKRMCMGDVKGIGGVNQHRGGIGFAEHRGSGLVGRLWTGKGEGEVIDRSKA
ncbi:hypothetical protein Scep_015130 [Stephania cephalantha]|uniref:Uncharacterized protein n=1 Tax=Stephania cephalantha TaxID=152367 RepID=A0AAP0J2L5_9MAGN